MARKEMVDWNEPPLVRWLGGITRPNTKATYKSGYRLYAEHMGMTASQLIDEALEDQKRDAREKTDIVKQRLIGFYTWLVEEAPKRKGGSGEVIGKGVSSKIAHTYVNAVRSFYGTYEVYVKLKGRSRLPKARVSNKRMILSNVEVKKVVDHARNPRDRALILTMFQSGMDVSTLCSLKYDDVAEGLTKNEQPLKLNLYRPKTGTEYYTFLGRDAIESLKAYLNDVKARGIQHRPNDPLFHKQSMKALTREAITTNLVQNMLRDVAIKSGFVDENLNGKDFNPLSPHALRESFGSIMTNKGVPDSIVDFWLGHEIGEMSEAYKRGMFEDLRRIYLERESFISITSGAELGSQVKLEIEKEVEDEMQRYKTENLELRSRLSRLELDHTEMKRKVEDGLSELRKELEKLIA